MLKQTFLIIILLIQSSLLYAIPETKIVLHFNDLFKLQHLEKSVKNIRKELGENIEIKVVVNGKAVQLMLKNDLISTQIVNHILANNADIGLCHNALKNNHVKKNMLIKGLRVLPQDGNVTLIKLQKAGYIYIKI